MHLPNDGVKACRVSKVHDKVVIHGMDCEYHIQSRKDPGCQGHYTPRVRLKRRRLHEDSNLERVKITSDFFPKKFATIFTETLWNVQSLGKLI